MNDEETKVQWAVELKQLLANSKAEAKKEFELFSQEYAYVDVESTTAPPSTRTSTKTRKRVDPSGESEETHPKPRPRRSRRLSQQQDAASDDDMEGQYPGKRRRKSEVEPMTHWLFWVWRGGFGWVLNVMNELLPQKIDTVYDIIWHISSSIIPKV